MRFLALLLVSIGLMWTGVAQSATPLTIDDQTRDMPLNAYIQLLEDPTRSLTLVDVTTTDAHRFQPEQSPDAHLGHTDSVWWLRLPVTLETSSTRYLWLSAAIGGEVTLSVLSDSGQTLSGLPFVRLLAQHRTPAWELNLPTQQHYTFYLRIDQPENLLRIPLYLSGGAEFFTHSNRYYFLHTLVFAGLLVLTLYNLLLYLTLRHSSYLSLCVLITCQQLILHRDSNLLPALSFFNRADHYFYTAPFLVGISAAVHFWRQINQNSNQALETILIYLQWGALVAVPFMGLVPDGIRYLFMFVNLLAPVLLIMITQTALAGHRETRSAYGAAAVMVICIWVHSMSHVGWLFNYNDWIIGLDETGVLLSALLLSINQADRSRQLREQAERAKAANEAKDDFLATMSHELRTPMHTITGIAELLRMSTLNAAQHNYLSKLEVATRQMMGLIDNILDMARINRLGADLESEPFKLDALLADLEQLFSVTAQQKGLQLEIPPSPTNAVLIGDKKHLNQVLINLVSNAIKYTDTGNVTLTVKQLSASKPGQITLRFGVCDTGIGIAPEKQKHLFKPFYQADNSRSRRHGGSGLGLAISDNLVRHMGGALEFSSIPHQGSQFSFTLHFSLEDVATAAAAGDITAP